MKERQERIMEHRLRQSQEELDRKAAKARERARLWTQEEIDAGRKRGLELAKYFEGLIDPYILPTNKRAWPVPWEGDVCVYKELSRSPAGASKWGGGYLGGSRLLKLTSEPPRGHSEDVP